MLEQRLFPRLIVILGVWCVGILYIGILEVSGGAEFFLTQRTVLQTIDISAVDARTAARLAYAPASGGSSTRRFYTVGRGGDNTRNPNIIDGKTYDMVEQSTNTFPADADAYV